MSYCCYANEESGVELEDEQWHHAAKIHSCCECAHKIQVGEYYQKITQLQDGRWWRYNTCEPCADLRSSLEESTCVSLEGLSEAFTDWLTHGPGTVMRVKDGSHAASLVPGYFVADEEEEDA